MNQVKLTLMATKRDWVDVAIEISAYVCAFASLFSDRSADWMSDKITTFVARYGFEYKVKP